MLDGSQAVVFFNRTGSAASMNITATELGWSATAPINVRDLWQHQDLAPFTGTFTKSVASHAAEVYRMSTTPISEPVEVLQKMDRNIAWLEKHGYQVLSRKTVLSVLQGMDPCARVFDLRGRAPATMGSAPAGVFALRPNGAAQSAAKMLWPGASH